MSRITKRIAYLCLFTVLLWQWGCATTHSHHDKFSAHLTHIPMGKSPKSLAVHGMKLHNESSSETKADGDTWLYILLIAGGIVLLGMLLFPLFRKRSTSSSSSTAKPSPRPSQPAPPPSSPPVVYHNIYPGGSSTGTVSQNKYDRYTFTGKPHHIYFIEVISAGKVKLFVGKSKPINKSTHACRSVSLYSSQGICKMSSPYQQQYFISIYGVQRSSYTLRVRESCILNASTHPLTASKLNEYNRALPARKQVIETSLQQFGFRLDQAYRRRAVRANGQLALTYFAAYLKLKYYEPGIRAGSVGLLCRMGCRWEAKRYAEKFRIDFDKPIELQMLSQEMRLCP